ncbi:hypothetical protein ACFWO9_00670, partial [Streptomyces sp. NPDC058441]
MSTASASPFANTVYERLLQSIPLADNGSPAWQLADPYLLRHAAQHAAQAGKAEELLQDPQFLIHAEPDTVNAVLREATTQSGRLFAAIYRTSFGVHRTLTPQERQQVLTLDAARFRAIELAAVLSANADWRPLWATGMQVAAANTAVLAGHTDSVNAVATAEVDGRPVAVTGSDDHTVRVWDLTTGRTVAVLAGHTDSVNAVATAEVDGRPVAVTGSDDHTVRVWDLTTGDPVGEPLTGHTDWVNAVAIAQANDRTVAVTASDDRTVRVWDLTTGHPVGEPLTGHTDWVNAVATAEVDGH